jgi:hypothetical protein
VNITNIKVRQYIYGILVAASPILIYRGIVDIHEAGLWLVLAGAVLGLSNTLALANLNKPGRHEAEA